MINRNCNLERHKLTMTGNTIRAGGSFGKTTNLPASHSGIDKTIERGLNS